jgi:outer membrane protein TolC
LDPNLPVTLTDYVRVAMANNAGLQSRFSEYKAAYFEFAYLAQAVEIAESNLELLKHLEQVAQARYRMAAASHPDIVRAQIELAMFEDEYLTLKRKKPWSPWSMPY